MMQLPGNAKNYYDVIRHWADVRPDQLAFNFMQNGEETTATLTFGQLDQEARAVAGMLQTRGLSGQAVLLQYRPGLDFIVAFFGCLYAGAIAVSAYPPTGNRSKSDRLQKLVASCGAQTILTNAATLPDLLREAEASDRDPLPMICTDQLSTVEALLWRNPAATTGTIAFLQYSSGSTGDPKGVIISHGNILQNQQLIREGMGNGPHTVFASWLPLFHDMGLIGNVMQPLFLGVPCHLMPPMAFLQKPLRWLKVISEQGVTCTGGPNFAYDLCVDKVAEADRAGLDLSSWSVVYNGAEPIRAATQRRFLETYAPHGVRESAIYPCYGLAEATLFVTGPVPGSISPMIEVDADALESGVLAPLLASTAQRTRSLVSCGKPWGDQQVRIVHPETRKLCAAGEIGEIWLQGESVSRGYWMRPDADAAVFQICADLPDAGLFCRTGDLGTLLDGELYVTGRLKELLIVRGRNHYPQDIEATVQQAWSGFVSGGGAAFLHEGGQGEQLVVVQEVGRTALRQYDHEAVLQQVRERVAAVHGLTLSRLIAIKPATLAKTSSGKIRRGFMKSAWLSGGLSLVEGQSNALDAAHQTSDQGLVALALQDIAIPLPRLDPNASLLQAGLDSLQLIELQGSLGRRLGSLPPIEWLFSEQSLAELEAALINLPRDSVASAVTSLATTDASVSFTPATSGQRRLWLLDQQGAGSAYNIAAGIAWQGKLNLQAWCQALNACLARHPALRTLLIEQNGELSQQLADAQPMVDLIPVPEQPPEDWLAAFANRPFDLAHDLPIRVCMTQADAETHYFFISVHHTAIDGWGFSVLLKELRSAYDSFCQGTIPTWPVNSTTMADVARRQHSAQHDTALAFWRERLTSPPVPIRFNGAGEVAGAAFAGGDLLFDLPIELCNQLSACAASSGVTPYHWLLAVYKLLLSKYAGQRDLCVLVPVANRSHPDTQPLVGFLTNTVVSRSVLDPAQSLLALVQQEAAATRAMLPHQGIPFEQVVADGRARGDTVPSNLMFSLQTVSEQDLALPGLRTRLLRYRPQQAKFDLCLTVEQRGQHWQGLFDYRQAALSAAQVATLAAGYQTLLRQALADPQRVLGEFALAEPSAPAALARPTPWQPVLAQIAAQVAATPQAVALVQGDQSLDYATLWARVGATAEQLRQHGLGAGQQIGLQLPASPALVIALLASLAVGAAYVPLDPQLPLARRQTLIEEAQLSALFLTAEPTDATVTETATSTIPLLTVSPHRLADWQPTPVEPTDAAYLIFTSGSTGRPKAARVHHGGLTGLLQWYRQTCLTDAARVLVISNPSFDLTQKNLLGPLTCGGQIGFPSSARFDPQAILQALQVQQAQLVNCTPTAFHSLLLDSEPDHYRALASLRQVVLGGEPIQLEPLRHWQQVSGSPARILNSYGPTECADVVAYHWLAADLQQQTSPVPLGHAVAGCWLQVVDQDGQPLPEGVVGELQIDGDCVGLGYFQRPDLTVQAFLSGGLGHTGQRYRTGDLVYCQDGCYHYLGRRDQQIKLNGYRIELGEIEAALLAVPAIAQAAVALRQDDHGHPILVGFYQSRDGQAQAEASLRQTLAQTLASYQLPARYLWLPELPLTRSGKVDRNALPQHLPARQEGTAQQDDWTASERQLAGLWQTLLGQAPRQRTDDFFALGGHSLLALELVRRVRQELGLALSVEAIFRHGQLADMAQQLQATAAEAPIPALAGGSPQPATPGQQRLWLLDRLGAGSAYHVAAGIELHGPLQREAWQQAVLATLQRHPALRTRLQEHAGQLQQHWDLPAPDCALQSAPASDSQALLQAFADRPFDLAQDAPCRSQLICHGPEHHTFLLCLHHSAIDEWAMAQLLDELTATYQHLLQTGQLPSLPAVTLTVADWAVWQAGQPAQQQAGRDYWQQQLTPAVSPLRFGAAASDDDRAGQLILNLPDSLHSVLQQRAASSGVTPYHWLLAVYKLLLSKYAGQRDLCVLVPVANRSHPDTQPLVGFLTNTVVSRSVLDPAQSLLALVQQEAAATRAMLPHQGIPFEQVVADGRARGDTVPSNLMFSLQTVSEQDLALPGLRTRLLRYRPQQAKFDLCLTVEQRGQHWQGLFDYRQAALSAAQVATLAAGYQTLLRQALADPQRVLGEFALAEPSAPAALARPTPWQPVLAQIAAQVAATPQAVALVQGDQSLDYATLWARVGATAEQLRQHGLGAGQQIGLQLPASPALVIALLASLAVGAAYVPLDPQLPLARRQTLIEEAQLSALFLTAEPTDATVTETATSTIPLLTVSPHRLADWQPTPVEPTDAAYLIFTSGSTGRPKAARVHHGGLTGLLQWYRQTCLTDAARVLVISNPSFDLTQKNLLGPLTCGGQIGFPSSARFDPQAILQALQVQQAQLVNCTPTAFHSLLLDSEPDHYRALASLRQVVLGGEPIQLEPLRHWQQVSGSPARILNSYGPTECADVVAYHWLAADLQQQTSPVPLGHAVAGCWLQVVDQDGQPLPEGVVGELQIDGDCVGLGYFQRPDLTVQAFLSGGLGHTGQRYRTGDLVYCQDGCYHYLGRRDQQIKLNGYRIELGEIEAALLAVPAIAQAAVALRQDDHGHPILVGFYQSRDGQAQAEASLRQTLAQTLASYQLPARYLWLPELPLTRSGKVDRNALPQHLPARQEGTAQQDDWTASERQLAGLWQTLLGQAPRQRTDDFFALGGHSLLALELVRRVRQELGLALDIDIVFRHATLGGMASHLSQDGMMAALPTLSVAHCVPLTAMQRRLWFLFRLEGPNANYNMAAAYRLEGRLDIGALAAGLRDLLARHWILRSQLDCHHDMPTLQVMPYEIVLIERHWVEPAVVESQMAAFLSRPFDLVHEPLSRFGIWSVSAEEHYLLANIHHIACDGMSLITLFGELSEAYRRRRDGEPPFIDRAPVQFAELAQYQADEQQREDYRRQLAELAEMLRDAPPESGLPVDRDRSPSSHYQTSRHHFQLDSATRRHVQQLAAEQATTPFCVLLASWFLLLATYRRQHDLVVGVPIVCRDVPGSEDVIGPLLNTLAIRVDSAEATDFVELLRRTTQAFRFARDRRSVAFDDVVDAVNPPRRLGLSPLFQVQFVLDPVSQAGLALDGVSVTAMPLGDGSAKYDLNVHLFDDGNTIEINLDYRSALYLPDTIQALGASWAALLQMVASNPAKPLAGLCLLSAAQLDELNLVQSRPDTTLLADDLVHHLFEQQAGHSPDQVALLSESGQLSYGELNQQANQFAHKLIAAGVQPGDIVGVFQSRGFARIVSLFGILKAGATYLPIDPEWPSARRQLVLGQAACRAVVVEATLRSEIDALGLPAVLPYGNDDTHFDITAPQVPVTAEHPCYLMFTSGSTGVPKGVLIRHGGVAHDLQFLIRKLGLRHGHRVLQLTAFSFDPSVRDLFAALGAGASAVVVDDTVAKHPARIINTIVGQRVSHVLSMVPTLLRALLAEQGRLVTDGHALQALMLNGERLRGDDCRRARQLFGPALTLINQYGPTEATMTSATHVVAEQDLDTLTVPLGVPNANTTLFVVDAHGQPLPQGAIGEIWIAGPGLAAGYTNQPEQTAANFVTTQWDQLGCPLPCYRTGDLGRWRGDGVLTFHGRIDFQIKLRGNRIELGEIDAAIGQLPGVAHCATTIHEVEGQTPLLVAFMTSSNGMTLDSVALKQALSQYLPSHMVPVHFFTLPALPLTASGKVDRKRLPDATPYLQQRQPVEGIVPKNKLEQEIASVWMALLSLSALPNREANFFELGANSLLMVQARDRLVERLNLQLDVVDLFQHPSIAALGKHLQQQNQPEESASTTVQSESAVHAARRKQALTARRPGRPGLQ
ncbi:non-ribosomal peptide synthetase [Chitinivorax sp. B]|uniref:non-ribosomal peptide synthetase n=1 Tax=Chitinivorax sp. B TaxID=2502235 RepID=UPI001484F813|nr:non-ribosomal peptide synthetase [Chitinivorax sp. B]